MIVLDAKAVLALLKDEPAAEEVSILMGQDCRLTAVGVTEVIDHLIRVVGADEEGAVLDLAELDLLDPVTVDGTVATRAGLLRACHYHRSRCAVSLADCIAAEAARALGVGVATSDQHLLDVCHAEGIGTHPLADSTGATWSSS